MKRFSMAFCTSLISFFILGSPYATAAVVSEVLDSEIGVGEVFGVNVTLTDLSSADALLAFGFDVESAAGLSFIGANLNTQFIDDSLLLPDTDVAGSAFPALPGGEDIHLATLSFQATSIGTHLLSLVSDLEDPNEGLFTLLDPQIDLTSSVKVNIVPVPSALLLFCSGLFGLLHFKLFTFPKVAT
jgi:hypothetical protein